ncbi:MAG TPA: cytochrome c oxidase subunit 3 [Bacteroidales bacterium]|nr:cytochrome c oxidase subunit 3 [Bacteroidales bacterium]
MMKIFIASEAFFFLALIISYVVYSRPGGTLSSTAKYLDVTKTAIFSVLLFASSATMIMAESRLRKGKRKAVRFWILATVVLGLVFLFGQGTEYYHLYNENVTVSRDVFGSAFFTLTGFHGLHVLIGLIVLSVITYMFFSGKFTTLESSALDTASIYWHFVDGVWVVVFSVVYLGSLL